MLRFIVILKLILHNYGEVESLIFEQKGEMLFILSYFALNENEGAGLNGTALSFFTLVLCIFLLFCRMLIF